MDEIFVKIIFGQVIRHLRRSKKISQEKLAEIVGLHRTYISDVERGIRNVSLVNIVKISEALEISPSDLFLRMEKKSKKTLL